jgi:hypothetical protein
VSTDRLGEKIVTIQRTSNSSVTANVQLQEILANMLSTLQTDKIETMASVKESVKEGNEKLKIELERSAKEWIFLHDVSGLVRWLVSSTV